MRYSFLDDRTHIQVERHGRFGRLAVPAFPDHRRLLAGFFEKRIGCIASLVPPICDFD
jgi:hypothetical protein